MTSIFKHKKGNVLDVLILGIVIFALAVAIPTIYYVFNEVSPDLEADFVAKNNTRSEEILSNSRTSYPDIFDAGIFLIFMAAYIGTLVSSFFLDTHPVFFIISVFIFVVQLIALMYLGNVYIEFTSYSEFSIFESEFPITYWLASHSFVMSIIMGCTIFGVLYARTRV